VRLNPGLLAPAGAVCGGTVAALVAGLVHAGGVTALLIIVGTGLGALAGHGLHRLVVRGPRTPVPDEVRALPEVAAVCGHGYEVHYRRDRPWDGRGKWLFQVFRAGRACGYLDADYMEKARWLYVENVYVEDRHGNRGLATALLLCAALTTGCGLVTTSARTRQGAQFFAKSAALLKKYGVELRDQHP
jgi:hypothetical protein